MKNRACPTGFVGIFIVTIDGRHGPACLDVLLLCPRRSYYMCSLQELQMLNDPDGKAVTNDDSMEGASSQKPVSWSRRLQEARLWVCVSKNIDWMSRRVFPATFALFNLIYWSIYLSPPYYHCHITNKQLPDACIESAASSLPPRPNSL